MSRLLRRGRVRRLAALVACSFVAVPAFAVGIGPSVSVFVDGGLIASFTCADAEFDCSGKIDEFGFFLSTPDYQISLAGAFDPDPTIFYAGNVFDIGTANTFGFVFQQGIVPTPAPGTASHDQSGSFTDGGNGSVPVSFVAPPVGIGQDGSLDELFVFSLSTNGGASWMNAGIDLVAAFNGIPTAGSSGVQPAEDESGAGPAGAGLYDAMRVDVNFGLGGQNDRYTWNGTAQIVPEPGTALLMGLGLLGLTVVGRRR